MPANGSCGLQRTTLISGAILPLVADRVTIDIGTLPNQMLTYLPVGNGRFEPQFAPTANLFFGSTAVVFTIVSTNQSGTLAGATATTPPPPPMNVSVPAVGLDVPLAQGVSFVWQPATAPPAGTRAIAEVYDADRNVKLTCLVVQDVGSFTLPPDLMSEYFAQGPTSPLTLELRYELPAAANVGLVGTGDTLPVIFHAGQGRRWAAH